MSVHTFSGDNFEAEVLNSNQTVIVDFYADWCGSCKMMSPIIDEIAKEMPEIKVGKVNVDNNGDLAMKYNVSSIPTIMIIKNGEVSKTFVGVTEKETIKGAI